MNANEIREKMVATARKLDNEKLEKVIRGLDNTADQVASLCRAACLSVFEERHGEESLDNLLDDLGL